MRVVVVLVVEFDAVNWPLFDAAGGVNDRKLVVRSES